MKLCIIGGSRGTGAQLAALAVRAGHEVTVLSRSGTAPEGVRAVAGDATDPAALRAAVSGTEAVVVTVGGARGVTRQRAAVTRAAIAAMREVGARRLVVQSSLGAGDSGSQLPAPLRLLMKVVLAGPLADHDEQEAAVFASGLDWTVVRPSGLRNSSAGGTWRAHEAGDGGTLGGSIPRADLAAYLLEVLGDDATIGRAIGVSS